MSNRMDYMGPLKNILLICLVKVLCVEDIGVLLSFRYDKTEAKSLLTKAQTHARIFCR